MDKIGGGVRNDIGSRGIRALFAGWLVSFIISKCVLHGGNFFSSIIFRHRKIALLGVVVLAASILYPKQTKLIFLYGGILYHPSFRVGLNTAEFFHSTRLFVRSVRGAVQGCRKKCVKEVVDEEELATEWWLNYILKKRGRHNNRLALTL
jgi:hypothetical protein